MSAGDKHIKEYATDGHSRLCYHSHNCVRAAAGFRPRSAALGPGRRRGGGRGRSGSRPLSLRRAARAPRRRRRPKSRGSARASRIGQRPAARLRRCEDRRRRRHRPLRGREGGALPLRAFGQQALLRVVGRTWLRQPSRRCGAGRRRPSGPRRRSAVPVHPTWRATKSTPTSVSTSRTAAESGHHSVW